MRETSCWRSDSNSRTPRHRKLKTLQTLERPWRPRLTRKPVRKNNRKNERVGEDADQLPDNAIGNALAHRILAWDHIQHGEFDDAIIELGDAAALNQRDMWVRSLRC